MNIQSFCTKRAYFVWFYYVAPVLLYFYSKMLSSIKDACLAFLYYKMQFIRNASNKQPLSFRKIIVK